MRQELISISERNLMFVIGGQLFDQAPNRQPRNAEIIMTKVRDEFRKKAHNWNEFYTLRIDGKLNDYIKELLFGIPEFKDLNLSHIEFEKKIDVDDESRPKYTVTTRYDKYDGESWKTDFIDLYAFVQNVVYRLSQLMFADDNCFCCIHNKGTEACMKCNINSDYKNNYECGRNPKGIYTFSCKYDCFKGNMICCEECKDTDTCERKCDSNSQTCGLAINRK